MIVLTTTDKVHPGRLVLEHRRFRRTTRIQAGGARRADPTDVELSRDRCFELLLAVARWAVER